MVRHIESDEATSVVAWFYESPKRAFRALLALQQVEQTRGLKSLGVVDAAVMSGAVEGRVAIDRSIEFHEGVPGRLSVVFPPAILAQPALGPEADAVVEHFSALGFQVNVLREIGENMPQDGASVVVLLREEWFHELSGILTDESDMQRWALEVEGPMAS